MFLSSISPDAGLHELDFRFEAFPVEEEFVFAHHGAKLNELLEVCALPSLGSTFYMVEMAYPFSLPDVIGNRSLFLDRYGIEPSLVCNRFLQFDSETLARFFENTRTDTELDCTLIGTDEPELAEQDFQRFLDALKCGPSRVPLMSLRSWVHTHDNHFLWLATKPLGLLRRLIAASLVGFFNHIHPRFYTPVPDNLIDLILSKYHTAPLVCFPTEWDWSKADEVVAGVQVEIDGVQALVETAASSWIAYQLNPPSDLVGRGLLISYKFQMESWSVEEWR
jgi:hypothetical protein